MPERDSNRRSAVQLLRAAGDRQGSIGPRWDPGGRQSNRRTVVFCLAILPDRTLVSDQRSSLRYGRDKRLTFPPWRNPADSCKISVLATGLEGLQSYGTSL